MDQGMKNYLLFNFGVLCSKLSDWALQAVPDSYLDYREKEISQEVDERMFDLGLTKFTIFHINQGPTHRDHIPDDDGIPEHCEWLLEVKCRINDDPDVVDVPLWFEEFNEAYAIVNHFYHSVEPKVLFV